MNLAELYPTVAERAADHMEWWGTEQPITLREFILEVDEDVELIDHPKMNWTIDWYFILTETHPQTYTDPAEYRSSGWVQIKDTIGRIVAEDTLCDGDGFGNILAWIDGLEGR